MEETGCEVEITDYLGTIIEEKTSSNFKQISYVYVSKVIKDTKELHMTDHEKEEGAILHWMSASEALEKISDCESKLVDSKYASVYQSKFMVRRDAEILKYYLGTLKK